MRQVTSFSPLGILFCLVSSETRLLILQVHYKASNVSHTLEEASFGDGVGGGGGGAAVTFLCKHHGEIR